MYHLHTATDTAIKQGTSKYYILREIEGHFGCLIVKNSLLNDKDVINVINNPYNQGYMCEVWMKYYHNR